VTSDGVLRAPYPGLRSFRREETDLFFGREDCINGMVDLLASTHFLAVLGSSGSGKSSLVKTGLLDALELGVMAQAGSRWRVIDFRPGGSPLNNLARRMLETRTPDATSGYSDAEVDRLRAFLARGPRSIVEWCRDGHLPEATNLLLLVDQFEELFRYQDYAGREQAEAFVALLLESAHNKEFPIYVTITMRSEFLGACALIEDLAEAINTGLFLTPRMTREQCRDAIVGPAKVCGIEIEPALVNRLLNDMANFSPWDERDTGDQLDRIMRRADQLPLLQYTLNRMWLRQRASGDQIRLTVADYEAIGGLSGALDAHANQILEDLGKDAQPVAEKVFRALISGSTIADAVRRPTRFDELVAMCGGDAAAVRRVVDAFRAPGCNFLHPEIDPKWPRPLTDDTYIDISHESLIRQWKKLSEWLGEEADAAQRWRRLNDRFAIGELLRGRELANLIAWRDETNPNPAWARRYGGDYPAVMAFLNKSYRAERRRRGLLVSGGVAISALLAVAAFVSVLFGITAEHERQNAATMFAKADQASKSLQGMLNSVIFNIVQRQQDQKDKRVADLAIATEVLGLVLQISKTDPDNVEYQRYVGVILVLVGDAKQNTSDMPGARKAFDESLGIARKLVLRDSQNILWLDDVAIALGKIADLMRLAEDFEGARIALAESVDFRKRVTSVAPDEIKWQQKLSSTLDKFGDVLRRLKRLDEALKIFEDELAIDRKIAARDQSDLQKPQDVAWSLTRVGDTRRLLDDLTGARDAYKEALEIRRQLLARDADNIQRQRDLSNILNKLASVLSLKDDAPGALKAYEERLELDRKIAELDQKNTDGPRDVAVDLDKIGDLRFDADDITGAQAAYEEATDLFRKLVALGPTNTTWQQDLAINLNNIGKLNRRTGHLQTAAEAYTEAADIRRTLIERGADDVTARTNLTYSLNKLADIQLLLPDLPGARKSYEEVLAVYRALGAREPANKQWQDDIATSLSDLADVELKMGDVAAAKKTYEARADTLEGLVKIARDADTNAPGPSTKKNLVSALGSASWAALLANRPQPAAKYAEEALALDPSQIWIDINRAHAYLLLGRFNEAMNIYRARKDLRRPNNKSYTDDIKDDFAQFRKLGIGVAELTRVENELKI
jgi:tetratricopeptide (TPR) repeat protein